MGTQVAEQAAHGPACATSADLCRHNGWKVGDLLEGDEGQGPTVIRLTALGETQVLARVVSHQGEPERESPERSWGLTNRPWKLHEANGPLAVGDVLRGQPCVVTITTVGREVWGACSTCGCDHIVDQRMFAQGRGPWKRDAR